MLLRQYGKLFMHQIDSTSVKTIPLINYEEAVSLQYLAEQSLDSQHALALFQESGIFDTDTNSLSNNS